MLSLEMFLFLGSALLACVWWAVLRMIPTGLIDVELAATASDGQPERPKQRRMIISL